MSGLGDVRGGLEHQPWRGGQDADAAAPVIWAPQDAERALDALCAQWGDAYDIGIDGSGRWVALRRDGLGAVSGNGPDQLLAAIFRDYGSEPVRPR